MKNKFKNNGGFTLVEMLIAVSLFIVIVTISIGALLIIFDANRKSQSSKTVVDNLNLSIENMARTIRFGTNYYCGISSDKDAVADCPTGGNSVSVTFGGSKIAYRLKNSAIQRSDNPAGGESTYFDITSPDTVIENLTFRVFGTTLHDPYQPYVVAVIKGHVGNRSTTVTDFSIETLMSQRKLDY
jgi:type II secretory pathway pseudopilin PulG